MLACAGLSLASAAVASDRLPPDYELCLFRVAQECLINTYRHSGSSTAVVRLLQTPDRDQVGSEGRRSRDQSGNAVETGCRRRRGSGFARNARTPETVRRQSGNGVKRKGHHSGRHFAGRTSEDIQRQSIVVALIKQGVSSRFPEGAALAGRSITSTSGRPVTDGIARRWALPRKKHPQAEIGCGS